MSIFNGGSYVSLTNPNDSKRGGGLRSNISDFSNQSRRRLLTITQKINRQKISSSHLFFTVTYPRSFPNSHIICKRHLDNLLKRLQRLFPNAFIIWRLEYQVDGGTKRGAPHYHFMMFFPLNTRKVTNIRSFRRWLARAWFDIVGSDDPKHLSAGTQADFIRNWRGVIFYCSKYLSKTMKNGVPSVMVDLPGRFWGIAGRVNMPFTVTTFQIEDELFFTLRRIFINFIESNRKQKYRYRNTYNGCSVYLDSAAAHDLINGICLNWPVKLNKVLP